MDSSPEAAKPAAAAPKGAGPVLRTGAFAIDAALIAGAVSLIDFLAWRLAPLAAPKAVPLAVIILISLYYGRFAARRQHTLGQAFAGLTLARVDYQPLTPRRASWRSFAFFATSGMAVPNLILMLLDPKRRTIHDWLTKTWVYALPDVPRWRRLATTAAAALLAVFLSARLAVALADNLEQRGTLTLEDVAAGRDGPAPAPTPRP